PEVGVVRPRGTGVRVDPQDRAIEAEGVAGRADVLGAQGPALVRRIAAGVDRRDRPGAEGAAFLARVGGVEAGAVTAGDVQRAFGPEREAPEGVTGVLLAPVLDEDVLVGHGRAGGVRREPREPARDHAAVGVAAGVRRGARVAPPRSGWSAKLVVVRVQRVDV